MSGSVRLRYIGTIKWPDMEFLPDLSDQHYDRLKKCGIDKKAYHHSSSYCISVLWTSNEKNLIFLIWKFFPDLLTSWVKFNINSSHFGPMKKNWTDSFHRLTHLYQIWKWLEILLLFSCHVLLIRYRQEFSAISYLKIRYIIVNFWETYSPMEMFM